MGITAAVIASLLTGTAIAVSGILVMVVSQSDFDNKPCIRGTIISIGACEKDGRCGVAIQTKDEIVYSTTYLPVLNQIVCAKPRSE
jgi:hypothetical protein